MTTPSPRERLAGAMATYGDATTATAISSGVTGKQWQAARSGRPVEAAAFLRICAAIGYDPLPELKHYSVHPSDFLFSFFGAGFKQARQLKGHSTRKAAKEIDASAATISRIEKGEAPHPTIAVLLRACKYIGVHPFGYMAGVSGRVSRETSGPARRVA